MFGIFEIFCNLPKIEILYDTYDVFVCMHVCMQATNIVQRAKMNIAYCPHKN